MAKKRVAGKAAVAPAKQKQGVPGWLFAIAILMVMVFGGLWTMSASYDCHPHVAGAATSTQA